MAERPIFIPIFTGNSLFDEIMVEFIWHPGMSINQKQKSIISLHESAKKRGIFPILEVSSKSDNELGKRLSAFNLRLNSKIYGSITVEAAFQGSKIFTNGGPFTDLYCKNGREIKKDLRLKESGYLKGFSFDGIEWALEPKTAFYDWLYLNALRDNPQLTTQVLNYSGFTDIEFNPKKSINCQARSCALYLSLVKAGLVKQALESQKEFINISAKQKRLSGVLFD